MRNLPSWIMILIVAVVGWYLWGFIRGEKKEYARERAVWAAEKDSLQTHGDGLFSKWAVASHEAESLRVGSRRLERLADSLHLSIRTKSRVALEWKAIAESLRATHAVTAEGKDSVAFALHQDGVHAEGYTLNPPPSARLAITHDPIELIVHIGRTKHGFTKGLIETPPYLRVSDWDLVVDDKARRGLFPDLRVVGILGGGPAGAHTGVGLRSGRWGIAGHWHEEWSVTLEKEWRIFGEAP